MIDLTGLWLRPYSWLVLFSKNSINHRIRRTQPDSSHGKNLFMYYLKSNYLRRFSFAYLFVCLPLTQIRAVSEPVYNVLFIVADDYRSEINAANKAKVWTPNLDALHWPGAEAFSTGPIASKPYADLPVQAFSPVRGLIQQVSTKMPPR